MNQRRTFSPEFKVRVVLEMISGEKGLMQASREYGIKDTVLSRWKQEFLERAGAAFRTTPEQPRARTRGAHRRTGANGGTANHAIGHGKKSIGYLQLSRPQKRMMVRMLTENLLIHSGWPASWLTFHRAATTMSARQWTTYSFKVTWKPCWASFPAMAPGAPHINYAARPTATRSIVSGCSGLCAKKAGYSR